MKFDTGQINALRNASVILQRVTDDVVWRDHLATAHDAYLERVQLVLDSLASVFGLKPQLEVHDHAGRNIAIDLAIPSELAGAFSFIAGSTDGKLFVMCPRPARMQLAIDSPRGTEMLFSQPFAVPANQLLRLQLEEIQ